MVGVVDALAGAVLVAAGVVSARSPGGLRFGVVAAAAGLAWWAAGPVGSLVFVHRPLLAQAALSYPSGRLGGWGARVVVGWAWLGAVILPVGAAPVATVVLGAGLGAVAAWPGPVGAVGAQARVVGVRRWVALVLAVTFAGPAAARLVVPVTPLADVVALGHALGVVAAGALLSRAVLLRVGGSVDATDAVVELADRRAPEVEAVLAEVGGGGGPVAGSEDPGVRVALGRAAGLLALNSALQADLEAQVAAVRRSRRRLVAVVDVESRRLERRLVEGPGHLLDELEGELAALAASVVDGGREQVGRLQGEVAGLRDDLARLGRGLHPRRLTDGGLGEALAELAGRGPLRVTVAAPERRFPAVVETTAWYVAAEAVANAGKHAGARSVAITVGVDATDRGDEVVVTVVDDGVGGARVTGGRGLAGLRDRLDAVGGRLEVGDAPGGGTSVRAWVPAR